MRLCVQSRYEGSLQQKLALQQRLQSLRAEQVLHETPGKRKQQQLGDDSRLVEVLMRKQVQGGGEGGHLGSRDWGGRLSR